MFPVLQLGPAAIRLPGLFILAGVWIGVNLVERSAPRHKLSASHLTSLIFVGLTSALVAARLGFVARHLPAYLENPAGLLSLDPATLAIEDGLLAGLVGGLVYGARKRLPLWPTLDALTPGMAAAGVALGFTHLASGDAYGMPTSIPWAIELWGELRHPSQVYEIAASLSILCVALWAERRLPFEGFTFLLWVGLTAFARLFLEAFRGDSLVLFGSVRSAQVLSLIVLIAVMAAVRWRAGTITQKAA